MLELLRAWLNGDREYTRGVMLYTVLGKDKNLVALFRNGKTATAYSRLQDELMKICLELKSKSASQLTQQQSKPDPLILNAPVVDKPKLNTSQRVIEPPAEECKNPELYKLTLKEADTAYKNVMNLRAELFALARVNGNEDPNMPDIIQKRNRLAIDVVVQFNHVSQLYDKAEHVRKTGELPHITEDTEEYDAVPDHLVKQSLDNLRKAYNKLKKKDATSERLALLQKHEGNIKKLEQRWHLLKPQK